MLIAVMGDTFSRVYENRYFTSLRNNAEIVTEFNDFIWSDSLWGEDEIILVLPDLEEDDQSQEWEGSFNVLRKSIRSTEKRICDQLDKVVKKQ